MCKVSVIIPYFNRQLSIIRALESVKNQTYQDYEIVLIDDGSSDEGHRLVDEFIQHNHEIRIKHIYQQNSGPSKARNVGIIESEGEYIAFLDSDDSWDINKLMLQIQYMEQNKHIMISGTNYIINSNGTKRIKYEAVNIKSNFYKMLFKVFYSIPTVVIRREAFEKHQFCFLEGRHHAEDNLIFLQIARQFKGIRFGAPLTTIYKEAYGEGGLTAELNKLTEGELDNFSILYKENNQAKLKIPLALYKLVIFAAHLRHYKRLLNSNRKSLFGLSFWSESMKELIDTLQSYLLSGKGKEALTIFTPNVDHIITISQKPNIQLAYKNADILVADGWPVAAAAKTQHITGVEIMEALILLADKLALNIYFLGAEDSTLTKLSARIRVDKSNTGNISFHNGFFGECSNQKIIKEIVESGTSILFVGMGHPKQELWINQNCSRLNDCIIVGVGGAFKVFSGEARRAPALIRKARMEWFWRFLQEPKRLFTRYFIRYPKFIPLLFQQLFHT